MVIAKPVRSIGLVIVNKIKNIGQKPSKTLNALLSCGKKLGFKISLMKS